MNPARGIRACYSDDYCVRTRSRSLEKLAGVAHEVTTRGLARVMDPGVLPVERLLELHDPDYVRAFLDGKRPLATSQNFPWSTALRRAVLAMQAGQLTAAEWALETGVAGHIANGFHHARYARGGGFCTFNGLALIARAWPNRRVFVLDCDEHGGNGTAEFSHWLPNLFAFSIFGTPFGCTGGRRSIARRLAPLYGDFSPYREALAEAFENVTRWQPDILVYQAGGDCHIDDPMGTIGLTTEQLRTRDEAVFAFCAGAGIPVLFTLGGSYQPLERSAAIHANTFEAAVGAHPPLAQPRIA